MHKMFQMACIAAATLLCAGPAVAQSGSYSADDIVAHFASSANLGTSRGLCIGTATQCGVTPEKPKPFDLRVQFDLGSADLTASARTKLATFAEAATTPALSRARFYIDGHTDGRGDDNTNQNLSEMRAQSVVSYLEAHGVDGDRLIARGFGESEPLAENLYDDVNRRVEASLAGVE